MFWDDENDSESDQKWKNLLFVKFWGTNKERDDTLPIFGIILLVVFVIALLIFAFHK